MIDLKIILISAIIIESITIFGRFFLNISSKKVYIRVMKKFKLKRFYHFHHLFTGIIIAVVFYFYYHHFFFNLGLGIFLSDLIHHFAVLWIVLKHPEFHVVYKNVKDFEKEEKFESRGLKRAFNHLVHKI